MYKDVTDKTTLPTCVVQREGFDLLHTVLVTEPTIPVVLVPTAKPEPVSSSRHQASLEHQLQEDPASTLPSPGVYLQPWFHQRKSTPNTPTRGLSNSSEYHQAASIDRGKAAAKGILPLPPAVPTHSCGHVIQDDAGEKC